MQFECAGSVAPAIHRHASLTPCLLESDGTEEFRFIVADGNVEAT